MGWLGHLDLRYRHDVGRCIAHDRHEGPLRVLAALYPESPAVCHHVLVHPPGGVVGGDRLSVQAELGPESHALITTPGATRFYRSDGAVAEQGVHARLAPGSRLEWLPLEAIAYRDARAQNSLRFELAPGAEMIGWDVLALGLPAAGAPFDGVLAGVPPRGWFRQQIALPGQWLERGRIDALDTRLLDSPLGWAGHRCLATMWFAAGSALAATRVEALLESARATAESSPLAARAGATSAQGGVVVVRVLSSRVEPAMALLTAIWACWRRAAWGLAPCAPRVWRT